MATDTLNDLHFELERSISRRVDSKLIPFQVSISDGFYDKYTKLWKKRFSKEFVVTHRPFYAQLTKSCVYEPLKKIDRKAIIKQLAELEALIDISETTEEFQMYFERKYHRSLPDLKEYIHRKKKELSNFDRNLKIAINYNPKEE
ncbi:Uncharacterised protein [Chlamydia trachomatis]|nr:Uncharacterised protein [Chlamydia trachomatis]